MQILEQEQGDQRGPDLRLQGVLAGGQKTFDAEALLDPFEQQGDILPINIGQMKSRSTIDFIRCARRSFR